MNRHELLMALSSDVASYVRWLADACSANNGPAADRYESHLQSKLYELASAALTKQKGEQS
jgi:hypothetical protein